MRIGVKNGKAGVSLISLGCSKNLVDSEVMLGLIRDSGFRISPDPSRADVVVVNTCGFIESARQEAVQTIEEMRKLKEAGALKALIVAGCYPKWFKDNIIDVSSTDEDVLSKLDTLRGADAVLGPGDFSVIGGVINSVLNEKREGSVKYSVTDEPDFIYGARTPRVLATAPHTAYIKIAEGCSNRCSYCLIPSIRGDFRSRKIESVVEEAKALAGRGVVEVNLIAQDTTNYGSDIYGRKAAAELLEKLSDVRGLRWIRLMYAHPAHFDAALIAAVRDIPNVCKYVDLPVQHIDDGILREMGRKAGSAEIFDLIGTLRAQIKDVVLRTSVIVGLPGETDRKFEKLLDFIRQTRFERLGAFKYSREKGTAAYGMEGQVAEEIKESRLDAVMSAQQDISLQRNEGFVGKGLRVLVDRALDDGRSMARTEGDAPDVDCSVIVTGNDIVPGSFVDVIVEKAGEYDLEARVRPKTESLKNAKKPRIREEVLAATGKK